MEPLKTSSFQLPNGQTVETVYVKLADGQIVARAAHELVERPTLPKVQK